ncbi:MAG: patatin-like phospholipase family protein [Xanthomonadales bacterium]|nr:patatin-like phospholipase family protein [Xanthomonadales bacterium]
MIATPTVHLALQGGGAHGAFTWGVLDALLEDGRIGFEGLCGTSAGAMNAVVMAHGLLSGGRDGARAALRAFWLDIAAEGRLWSPVRPQPDLLRWFGIDPAIGLAASHAAFDAFTRMFSPYQFNPFDFNPLRTVIERHVDFQALSQPHCLKLFVCATNVRTGKVRIFGNTEMSVDALLASACLPQLFRAVEIDGEAFWDGGYMGNPVLYPLFYRTVSSDIVLVHVNPIARDEVPRTPEAIANRVNEISFNSSLMREMRAIAFAARLVEEGWLRDEYRDRVRAMHIHAIRDDALMAELTLASKLSPDLGFLTTLHDYGREVARRWLAAHFDDLGVRSSVDLRSDYL